MSGSYNAQGVSCLGTVGRRGFLEVVGASALALKMGLLDYAADLLAGEVSSVRRPRVQVVFVRPDDDRYWMSWPGASYDVEARQAEYTRTLTDAARRLGVDLEVHPLPLHDPEGLENFVARTKQMPPDGLFASVMHLKSWPQVEYLLKHRGPTPAVVFAPLGSAFPEQLQTVRGVPRTFVASTPDPQWPAFGLKMLKSLYEMQHARLCMVTGKVAEERVIQPLGTTLRYVPLERWVQELARVDTTAPMQAIAAYYTQEAQKIVEPRREDILAAAKNYVVARRIMSAERCQGISVDCYSLLNERRIACGMCLAWSRLLDEGLVGACEADGEAAVTQLLSATLLSVPGFMQDPAANTLRNTLVGAHCTCPTRLDGFDRPHQPFVLRNQAESASGVALQVLWRPGQEITFMKYRAPNALVLGTGRVVDNIQGLASNTCRTAVEIQLDGVADARNVKGHHQVLLSGRHDEPLRAFAELAGLKVAAV